MYYGSQINAGDANDEGSTTRSTRLISQSHSEENKLKGGEGWLRGLDISHQSAPFPSSSHTCEMLLPRRNGILFVFSFSICRLRLLGWMPSCV